MRGTGSSGQRLDIGIGDQGDRSAQGAVWPCLGCRDLYGHCPRWYVGRAESGGVAGGGGVVVHPVIASGGISRVEDLQSVQALGPRVEGAIVGKALYDGKLDYRPLLQLLVLSKALP